MTPREEEERGRNDPLWMVRAAQQQDRLEFLMDRTALPRYVLRAAGSRWAIWDRRMQRQACGDRLWDSPVEAMAYAEEMRETAALEEGAP